MGFIHIFFKFLEHIYNSYFEILVLYFSYIAILRAHCSNLAEFLWRHIIMALLVCLFVFVYLLVYRHPGLSDCDSSCWCLVLSLSSGGSVHWF